MTITHVERDLWIAVFFRALDDLTGKDARYKLDSRCWFQSSDENVGSFIWVCRLLGVESTAIRRGLTLGSLDNAAQNRGQKKYEMNPENASAGLLRLSG